MRFIYMPDGHHSRCRTIQFHKSYGSQLLPGSYGRTDGSADGATNRGSNGRTDRDSNGVSDAFPDAVSNAGSDARCELSVVV
jgi:hypothetical protein